MHWQNLLSDGRFNLPEIWRLYQTYLPWMLEHDTQRGPYRPQVAVVVDERSYYYERVPCREVYVRWVYELRSSLTRVDTTLGFYLQSDLARIPDSVRCLILLTPYALTAEQQDALRNRWMRDGRTIVFCHLPNIFGVDGIDPKGSAVTGIDLALHQEAIDPESKVCSQGLFQPWNGETFGDARDFSNLHWNPDARVGPVSPFMTVADPQAEILARYVANGLPSCAIKRMDGWNSVFLGTHRLSPRMWRALFRDCGCHVYLDTLSDDWDRPDVVEANDSFLMIQSGHGGKRTVRLPKTYDSITRFDGQLEPIARHTDRFEVVLEAKKPSYFLLE